MRNFSFNGRELPDWLDRKLRQMSPDPNANTVIQLLLEDYIARNQPCEHQFEKPKSFWDPSLGGEVETNDEVCRKCGVRNG